MGKGKQERRQKMEIKTKEIYCIVILILSLSLLTYADVKLKGEISGVVVDENGEVLPGTNITLTGAKLFQKSLSTAANERGLFRFLNLNPGSYELEISIQGFNIQKIQNIRVKVGHTTPIKAVLTTAKISEEIEVVAEAPLIETKTTQLSTNYSNMLIEHVPTERKILDLMDAVPGINDKGAYGAGALYDTSYAQGSVTSAVRLNGVDVSDINVGHTWVNPNYDTVEEIQVVGIGASAEYGNFTGATVNIITKSGSNEFRGGLSLYYIDNNFYGDNSGGIEDLKHGEIKYNPEGTIFLGGPVIKEKLFFFLAGGYTALKSKVYKAPDYTELKQPHFQARLDWLAFKNNTFSLMVNTDPLNHDNKGLKAGMGPEIAYSQVYRTTALFGNWQSILSNKTVLDLKYGGFWSNEKRDPVSPDAIGCNDYSTGKHFGSAGFIVDNKRYRHEVDAAVTHYAEEFLGASHEFKFGVEYQKSFAQNYRANTGAVWFYPFPAGDFKDIRALIYKLDSKVHVERIGGYVQDNISIGSKAYLNLGIRFDLPRLTAERYSGTIVRYDNISPRIGFSYDFTGDAKNVAHLHYGRYYDKMVTYGMKSAYPATAFWETYRLMVPASFEITEGGLPALADLVLRPENLWIKMGETLLPIEEGTTAPYTDVFNIGFEKQIFKEFALSIDYIYKRDRGFLAQLDRTKHSYEQVEWTDPWIGNTVAVWGQTDLEPNDNYFGNSSWAKRRHHFVMLTFRKNQIGKWSMMASFVYQNSEGNIDNTEGQALGFSANIDNDPNYTQNPLVWGRLSFDRTYQFKLIGTYLLPYGVSINGDFRLLSGRAWSPWCYSFYVPGVPTFFTVPLEKRGSRRNPAMSNLNLRLAKSFKIGHSSELQLSFDILNVFNKDDGQYYWLWPYAIYPISGEPAMGKPQSLFPARRLRLGARWTF